MDIGKSSLAIQHGSFIFIQDLSSSLSLSLSQSDTPTLSYPNSYL